MDRRTVLKLIGIALLDAAAGCDKPVGADDRAAASPPTPNDSPKGGTATVNVKVINSKGEIVGPVESARVVKTDEQWKAQLSAEQYQIARAKGTERPFCGNLLDNHKKGVYACVCCGLPLFSSDSKFNSGTGWPSFFQPVAKENVTEHVDRAYGMERKEILCARCDCHLGHVFDDGPRPTGLRFCVNSESLKFVDNEKLATLADPSAEKAAAATRPS